MLAIGTRLAEGEGNELLKRDRLYPLADLFPGHAHMQQRKLRAIWDGRPKRRPKQGDWYLSGSIISAYRALNDLDVPYHIAGVVEVDVVPVQYRIVDVLVPFEQCGYVFRNGERCTLPFDHTLHAETGHDSHVNEYHLFQGASNGG